MTPQHNTPDSEAVKRFMEAHNFRWSQGGYWVSDTYGLIAPDQAAFIYQLAQAEKLRARIDTCDRLWTKVKLGSAAWTLIGDERIKLQAELHKEITQTINH